MENLLDTLKRRRDALVERGGELAGATRDRSLEALGKVRSGALDWHETIAARRSELEDRAPKWFRLTGLQLLMLDRFDQVLLSFGERVRDEIQRLSRRELASDTPAGAPAERAAPKALEPGAAKKTNGASQKAPVAAQAKDGAPKKATSKKAAPKQAAPKQATSKKASPKKASEGTARAAAKKVSAKTSAKTTATKTSATKTSKKTTAKTSSKKKTAKASGAKTAKKTSTAKKAPKVKSNGKTSRRLVMPIADYDALNAKEVLAELPRLSAAQCTTIYEHEKAHKKRKTVLRALENRTAS